MYRFRSIDNLLGKHKELESQEIYFASPDQLNDPMEGFRDMYWDGDAIVWRNFLLHYINSLYQTISLSIFLGESEKLTEADIPVYDRSKTNNEVLIIEEIVSGVFSHKCISQLPIKLEGRNSKIRRSELLIYLKMVHGFTLHHCFSVFKKYELIPETSKLDANPFVKDSEKFLQLVDVANQMELENPSIEDVAESFFSVLSQTGEDYNFINKYNLPKGFSQWNFQFIVLDFTTNYISRIEVLMYPDWYSASFMSECTNSSVWGHYGDSHKGVCLKFKSKELKGNSVLNLLRINGVSSDSNGTRTMKSKDPLRLHKISYQNNLVEIDFFRSIGRMPVLFLKKIWYSNESGDLSVCADHLRDDHIDKWRDSYISRFYETASIKLSDWDYEKEYRLIVYDLLSQYKEPSSRKFKYDFCDLEGLIFGLKTTQKDKLEIVRIIEEKCKSHGRKSFDFYQAYYSSSTGKIEKRKLDLLKFANPKK